MQSASQRGRAHGLVQTRWTVLGHHSFLESYYDHSVCVFMMLFIRIQTIRAQQKAARESLWRNRGHEQESCQNLMISDVLL